MHKLYSKYISITLLLISFISISTSSNADVIATEPGGQYATDKTFQISRIDDTAVDLLGMVDFLICMMQTRPDLYPSSNYVAKVDEAKCARMMPGMNRDAFTDKELIEQYLSCTRASNTEPQICKGWLTSTVSGGATNYMLDVQLKTSPTVARPNGEFTMVWCVADSDGVCTMSDNDHGTLDVAVNASDQTVVTLYSAGPNDSGTVSDTDNSYEYESLVLTLADHKLGSATGTTKTYTYAGSDATALTYDLDFDSSADLALVQEGTGTASCYNMASLDEYPREYDIYDMTTGVKKVVEAGIPVVLKTTSGSGTVGAYGWWDYWNVNVNGGADIIEGDVLTVQSGTINSEDLTGVDLTLEIASGALEEKLKYSGILSDDDSNTNATAAATTTMTRWMNGVEQPIYIKKNSGSGPTVHLKLLASQGSSITVPDMNGSGAAANTADNADITTLITWDQAATIGADNFGAHSDTVGGWFKVTDVSDVDNITYVSDTYERIAPNITTAGAVDFSSDVIFKCYGDRCPRPTSDGSNTSAAGKGYAWAQFSNNPLTFSYINPDGGTPQYYIFESSDMTLYYCGGTNEGTCADATANHPVICDATLTGGTNCSAGTRYDRKNLHAQGFVLSDQVGTDDGAIDAWADLEADGTKNYQWMTTNYLGSSDRLKLPKKADNSYVTFTRPLRFTYTPAASGADDRNATVAANAKYTLQYDGNGELHGFNWDKWSLDETPVKLTEAQINAQTPGNWRPEITFKDGVLVDTDTTAGNDSILLATRIDAVPTKLGATTNCDNAGLSIATSASFPTAAPANIASSMTGRTWAERDTITYVASGNACVVDNIPQDITGCASE